MTNFQMVGLLRLQPPLDTKRVPVRNVWGRVDLRSFLGAERAQILPRTRLEGSDSAVDQVIAGADRRQRT